MILNTLTPHLFISSFLIFSLNILTKSKITTIFDNPLFLHFQQNEYMQNFNIDFTFFQTFIIRIPTLPIDFYHDLIKKTIITDSDIKEILKDNHVKEAIFLASPELYNEIQKWISEDRYPSYKTNRLKLTILKYLSRMSTRCKPFGLFSACGSIQFANATHINLNANASLNLEKNIFYRRTRL